MAGSVGCEDEYHIPQLHVYGHDLMEEDGDINHLLAYSYYIAAFYAVEKRWPDREEMGERVDDEKYYTIIECAYSILLACRMGSYFDAPLSLRHNSSYVPLTQTDANIRQLIRDIKQGSLVESEEDDTRWNRDTPSINRIVRGGLEPMVRLEDAKDVIEEREREISSLKVDIQNLKKKIGELEALLEEEKTNQEAAIAKTIAEQEEKA